MIAFALCSLANSTVNPYSGITSTCGIFIRFSFASSIRFSSVNIGRFDSLGAIATITLSKSEHARFRISR